jgi:hypothetical protein
VLKAWRQYRWAALPVAVVLAVLAGYAVIGHPAPRPTAAQTLFIDPGDSASGAAAPAGGPAGGPAGPSPSASASPSAGPAKLPAGPGLHGCPNLPADNVWHADVTRLPVLAGSAAYVTAMGTGTRLKADFGAGTWDGGPIGIPITYAAPGTARVPVSFDYAEDSDRGPYPIPRDALVEGGRDSDGDRHVLVVDTGTCKLYEMWDSHPGADGSWHAGSGAVFDLRGNKLRPAGLTSADAAGLPVVPGLVRYEEVAAGRIDHAIRITVPRTQKKYVWPARHFASSNTDATLPPMGLRLRLKAGVDISRLPAQARIVAQAMKTYGVIVADNGSAWYVSGAPDGQWNNDALRDLANLHGGDFEAVDTAGLMVSKDSGQYK